MEKFNFVEFQNKCDDLFTLVVLQTEIALDDIISIDQTDDVIKIKNSVDNILKSIKIGIELNKKFHRYKKTEKDIYRKLRFLKDKKTLKLLNNSLNNLKENKNGN